MKKAARDCRTTVPQPRVNCDNGNVVLCSDEIGTPEIKHFVLVSAQRFGFSQFSVDEALCASSGAEFQRS